VKRFRSRRRGFQFELPSGWGRTRAGKVRRFLGREEKLIFIGPPESGYFSVETGPPFSGMNTQQIQTHVLEHARGAGYVEVEIGSISVQGKKHLWARYRTTGEASMRLPAARRIVRITRIIYQRQVGSMSVSSWLADMERRSQGPVLKTYWLTFDQGAYELTASLGFGAVQDVKADSGSKNRERAYDAIVSSFRVAT
jgi:hypothetical protein